MVLEQSARDPRSMIVVPVVVSVIWMAIARSRGDGPQAPLAPTTTVGIVALSSVLLVILVTLTDASLAVTLPTGIVMLGLGSFARWIRRDRGLLLVVPVVFGLSILLLPVFFE